MNYKPILYGYLNIDDNIHIQMRFEAGWIFANRIEKVTRNILATDLTQGKYSKDYWNWFNEKYDQYALNFLFDRGLIEDMVERRNKFILYVGARFVEQLSCKFYEHFEITEKQTV